MVDGRPISRRKIRKLAIPTVMVTFAVRDGVESLLQ